MEGPFPQEDVAQNPHHRRMFILDPQIPQIRDRVYVSLLAQQFLEKFIIIDALGLTYSLHFLILRLDEADDCLPIVFGNVLGFIFHFFHQLIALHFHHLIFFGPPL